MLQFIRERAQGLIAWVIVILIIIPFALWGINQYFRGGSEQPVAKVNGNGIPQRDFQLAYQQERAFRQSLMGDNFNPALMDEDTIKKDALNRLIRTEVLAQAAISKGYRIGDDQLGQTITGLAQFQNNGKFDTELYQRLLNARGMTPDVFEASLRRELLANQVLQGFTDSAMVMDYELDDLLRIKEQQRKIGYMTLKADDFLDDVDVTEDEIREYYESHLDRFDVPERVSIEYLELSADALAQNIQVDDETLRKLYQEQAANFTVGEERRASHILIKVEKDAVEQAVEDARAKAQDLLARIRNGEDFKELAKEFSEDAGSAPAGGDLGYFGRGMMVKPFEDKVFSMDVDEISGPVRTPFGFHIIKLTGVKPGHKKTFEELRSTLERDYKQRKAQEQFFEQADMLADMTYENPDTLSVAANALKLPVTTTGLFSRHNGQGIAADPKIREAAFSTDVLESGYNSEPIEIEQNHLIVLRIKEHKATSTRPLDEIKDQVIILLQRDKAKQAAEKAGQDILKRIGGGESVELVADEMKLEWNKTGFIERTDASITPEIVRAAFTLPKPAGSTPVNNGFMLSTGDYAIVSVYEVRDGDPAAVDVSTRETLKTSTLRADSQLLSDMIVEELKQRADITRYPDRL